MKIKQSAGSKSLSSEAYQAIKSLIVTERLLVDAAMSEAVLAKRLGISRTPVREAVRQLVQEGLLEQKARFGITLRKIDRRDLTDLYNIREALESHAAGSAAERLTERQLAQLGLLVEAMREIALEAKMSPTGLISNEGVEREMAVDKAFHMLILEAAGNRRMMKIAEETRMVSDLFRLHLQPVPRRILNQAIGFHERILQALQDRNGKVAAAVMAEHIHTGLIEAMNHYDQLQLANGIESGSSISGLPGDIRAKLSAL